MPAYPGPSYQGLKYSLWEAACVDWEVGWRGLRCLLRLLPSLGRWRDLWRITLRMPLALVGSPHSTSPQGPTQCSKCRWRGQQRACQADFLFKTPDSDNWKDSCWSWNSNTLATWYKELIHLKRLRAGGDGWMASPTHWTCLGKFQELVTDREAWRFMGSQRVRHDWAIELNSIRNDECFSILLTNELANEWVIW